MNQEQIHKLFKQGYTQAGWKQFLGETFSKTQLLASPERLTGIDKNVAAEALKLGYVSLDEQGIERQIAVFEVTLANGVILERNRVGLRNLLRKYWKNIDAAFIVYVNKDSHKWRFTYVSELSGYNAEGDFVKIKTEPKRYTYVLGEGESSRTAAERFFLISRKGSSASLEDVKDAFSVEKLSKAFFDEYKEHYEIFCKYMAAKPNIRQAIFNGDEKAIRDFVKKLLGRIVFLYFIQKKGWLGVPVNSEWGQGDFDFLTNLFDQHKNPDLFYTEVLSKLFFDTLNSKRNNDVIELRKGEPCRIPFLNGGLFEEDDKKHRNLIFTGKLFEDLFEFFNQYNFTIYEDDPNDHTVAVDPEMLGHIFENLLEDNKDKGAFYTPKEIVHYMCQESFIEYLTTWFENKGYEIVGHAKLGHEHRPEMFAVNEGKRGQLTMESTVKSHSKKIDRTLIENLLQKKLTEDDKAVVVEHAAEFHEALDKVKICDPAIGSGAFPMGLLQEIFTAKQTLYHFQHGNLVDFPASEVKLNIIQNSIYGVDIEKGAVDIARLRFWLSLVVDEETPKALPNLDYKIVVGNSLVSKLGDEVIDINWNLDETSHGFFGAELEKQKKEILKKISAEQREYFKSESDKRTLSADIRKLKIDLLIKQLELMVQNANQPTEPKVTNFRDRKKFAQAFVLYIQSEGWKVIIKNLQNLKSRPIEPLSYFDWKLDFPEIMNVDVAETVGFDIVIANPPYIDSETMVNSGQEALRDYLSKKLLYAKGNWDIYIAFFESSFNLLNERGNLVFITPDKWISKPFGDELRKGLINNFSSIAEAGRKVFQTAKVDSIITFLSKNPKPAISIDKFEQGNARRISSVDKSTLVSPFALDWLFSDNVELISKLELMENRLSDWVTCENACATSDAYKIKDYIIDSQYVPDKHLKIINTGTVGRYESRWGKREMTYLKDKYRFPVLNRNKFLRDFTNTYGSKSILPKIIIKGLTLLDGCLDIEGVVIPGKSTLVIAEKSGTPENLYLPLAIINSKLAIFYIKEKYRGSSYNQGINFNPDMINNIPVPNLSKEDIKQIVPIHLMTNRKTKV